MAFYKKLAFALAVISSTSCGAVEVVTDREWYKEERGYKYSYISEQPSEGLVILFTNILMDGVWERDIIAYGNSINSFQARIRTKDLTAKDPFMRNNRHWFDKALNGDTVSLRITGEPNEINDALKSYTERGYTPTLRKVGTAPDTVYLLLSKG